MKFLFIPFFFFLLSPASKHLITVKVFGRGKQPTEARLLLYQKERLIEDVLVKGEWKAHLEEGIYTMQVIRCDTGHVVFHSDKRKLIPVLINDDCTK